MQKKINKNWQNKRRDLGIKWNKIRVSRLKITWEQVKVFYYSFFMNRFFHVCQHKPVERYQIIDRDCCCAIDFLTTEFFKSNCLRGFKPRYLHLAVD